VIGLIFRAAGFCDSAAGFAVVLTAVSFKGFTSSYFGYGLVAAVAFLLSAFFARSLASVCWTTLAFSSATLSALSAGFLAGSAYFFLATNWRISSVGLVAFSALLAACLTA
jgi:hypothetical protein